MNLKLKRDKPMNIFIYQTKIVEILDNGLTVKSPQTETTTLHFICIYHWSLFIDQV